MRNAIGIGLLAAALALAPAAAPARGATDLLPVPEPAIANLEAATRDQLGAARGALEDALAAGAGAAALEREFGDLGRLYYLHDLVAPAEACFLNAARLAPAAADWPYYLGALYRKEGRLEEARAALERALEVAPDDLPTLLRLGELGIETGRLDAAETRYQAVLARDPDSAAAWYGLGRIAFARRDLGVAIERLETALRLQPEATSVHHLLGLAYRELDELERARHHLALNRHGTVSFEDPRIDTLAALARSAQFYLKGGNLAVERGDAERALALYRRAAEIAPEDPLVRYNLGLVLARRGDGEAALAEFRRAVELDPSYRNARFNLAAALAAAGRWDEAAVEFAAAAAIDPEDVEARLRLVEALLQTGAAEAAATELEALAASGLAESAALVGVRLELAGLLGRAGRFGAAAEQYAAVVAAEPDHEEARFGQAMALILGTDHAAARQALETSVAILPDSQPLLHVLARLLATCPEPSVRDGEKALELARRVFSASRTPAHAETLAMALAELGRFDEAMRWQREVVTRAEAAGMEGPAAGARRRLALYEQGRPVRAPWLEEG